jgi:hypothetical protein
VIRPDRELPVQKLVTLMDSLQRAQITKVGIATKADIEIGMRRNARFLAKNVTFIRIRFHLALFDCPFALGRVSKVASAQEFTWLKLSRAVTVREALALAQ